MARRSNPSSPYDMDSRRQCPIEEQRRLLSLSSLSASLTPGEVKTVQPEINQAHYNEGDAILVAGDTSERLCILARGTVTLVSDFAACNPIRDRCAPARVRAGRRRRNPAVSRNQSTYPAWSGP